MAANSTIRGGIRACTINGEGVDVAGNIDYNLGLPVREERTGAIAYLGVTEKTQPATMEFEIVDRGDLNLAELAQTTGATMHVELKNGKVLTGRDMTAVGDWGVGSEEGKIKAKFVGPSIVES